MKAFFERNKEDFQHDIKNTQVLDITFLKLVIISVMIKNYISI